MNTLHFPEHFSRVKNTQTSAAFFFNEQHPPGPRGGVRDAEDAQVPSGGSVRLSSVLFPVATLSPLAR